MTGGGEPIVIAVICLAAAGSPPQRIIRALVGRSKRTQPTQKNSWTNRMTWKADVWIGACEMSAGRSRSPVLSLSVNYIGCVSSVGGRFGWPRRDHHWSRHAEPSSLTDCPWSEGMPARMFTSNAIRMIRLPAGPSRPKEISMPAVRRKVWQRRKRAANARGFFGQLADAGVFFCLSRLARDLMPGQPKCRARP
jgi:hypothetical protein